MGFGGSLVVVAAVLAAVSAVVVVVWAHHLMLNCYRRAHGYFIIIGDKAPPAERCDSEVARTLNRHCYTHTGNSGHR